MKCHGFKFALFSSLKWIVFMVVETFWEVSLRMFLKKTIRRVQKAIGIVRSRSFLDLQKLLGYFGPSSDPGFPKNSGRSKTSVWNIKPHYQLDGSVRRSWGGTLGAIRWPADRSAGRYLGVRPCAWADRSSENRHTSKRILRFLTLWRRPKGHICWF